MLAITRARTLACAAAQSSSFPRCARTHRCTHPSWHAHSLAAWCLGTMMPHSTLCCDEISKTVLLFCVKLFLIKAPPRDLSLSLHLFFLTSFSRSPSAPLLCTAQLTPSPCELTRRPYTRHQSSPTRLNNTAGALYVRKEVDSAPAQKRRRAEEKVCAHAGSSLACRCCCQHTVSQPAHILDPTGGHATH